MMVTQSDDSSKKDSESNDSSSMDSPALLIKMKFSDSNIIQFGYEEKDVECFLVDLELRPGNQLQSTLKTELRDADAKILLDLLNDQQHALEDLNMPSKFLASVREALETHEEGDASQGILSNLVAFAGEELTETNSSLDVESLASLPVSPKLPKRYHREFTELQFLGKGGCGSVFLCRHNLDKREYAMKKIRVEDRDLPKFVLLEVTALSGMQSPRIIRYHQAWIEKGFVRHKSDKTLYFSDSSENSSKLPDEEAYCVYIQMEYCKNRTLKEFLDSDQHQPKNTTNLIWRLIRQILQGLAYIHKLNVIHRDIKPDNIFLDANDDAKIGDFGLAKIIKNGNDGTDVAAGSSSEGNSGEKLKDSSGVAGTSFYISPEVKNKSKSVDQKADIYSFGIMFFELWYHHNTETERAYNLIKLGKREIPNDWTESFPVQSALLAQMLTPDPLERPSARGLLQDLPSIPARSPTGSPL